MNPPERRPLSLDDSTDAAAPITTGTPGLPWDAPSPPGRIFGNGHFRTLITAAGTGGAWFGPDALTRWRGDRVEDPHGWFFYLRDLEDDSFWSLGHAPTRTAPGGYEVRGSPGSLTIVREQAGIETRMDVWVDPGLPIECRRVTIHNRSGHARHIELTCMLEVVIHHPAADAAHPGFSNLFVETEALPERGLLIARRRPRGSDDTHPLLALFFPSKGSIEFETDRARFIGRGQSPRAPAALTSRTPLSGTAGAVLDPILAVRRVLSLAPGAQAVWSLGLGAAHDREHALELSARCGDSGFHDTSQIKADAQANARLRRLHVHETEAERLEALGAALLYADPRLVPPSDGALALEALGDVLERRGLSPADPIVLVEPNATAAGLEGALRAHLYWRELGWETSLVIVTEDHNSVPVGERPPKIVIIPLAEIGAAEHAALRAAAHLVVDPELPPVTRPPAAMGEEASGADGIEARGEAAGPGRSALPVTSARTAPPATEDLRCFNGIGGFSGDGSEYVIRLERDAANPLRLPPRPWINVIANPSFGCLVSENGGGYTWSQNSREYRLTPWANDSVEDPHGEALYLIDLDTGACRSPLPGPAAFEGAYEMRHGFGYSRCLHTADELALETWIYVPESDPVKVVRLLIRNDGARARRLALASYQRLVLGVTPEQSARGVTTWIDPNGPVLMARQRHGGDFGDRVAFATVLGAEGSPRSMSADRETFIGRGGTPAWPAALRTGAALDGRAGVGLDPCFATRVEVEIAPGETLECAFLLGDAATVAEARTLVERLSAPGAVAEALDQVRRSWSELLGRARIETPIEELDLAFNGWLPYQALACRLWARSAHYQSGGAFGFRDQLQDATAFTTIAPEITRRQLLLNASHQFVEGDVLHWWHPPVGRGLRTRFADDLLWLPWAAADYVSRTGDSGVLDESAPYLTARALEPDEHEVFLAAEPSGARGDLYDHCCRAIDRSLAVGAHGLPLFGSGDWNDGMNRVGIAGRGESVWMGFFLHTVIEGFVPLCERRGETERAARYRAHQQALRAALESAGWDGAWYRRAYYDDGTPLGSASGDECQIDALVQAWAVISGVAPRERAESAMNAVERLLISESDGLVRLLAPPFDRTPHDPGYIKGYLPGVRENGGQYTHAALWVTQALLELGRRDLAARVLRLLSPQSHARSADEVAVYQVEPYVVAADVYGHPPHIGRGGWTWYTGSAGWMFRIVLESLLGVRIEGGTTLVIEPRVPDDWKGFRVSLRPAGLASTYVIVLDRPASSGARQCTALLDGRPVATTGDRVEIPLDPNGGDHEVRVTLG